MQTKDWEGLSKGCLAPELWLTQGRGRSSSISPQHTPAAPLCLSPPSPLLELPLALQTKTDLQSNGGMISFNDS